MKKSTCSQRSYVDRMHYQFFPRLFLWLSLTGALVVPALAQLELLKDINTAEELTLNEYASFTVAGHYMYFVSNQELWKTNGSTKYTVRMKSFTSISDLTMSGTTLFFTADDGISGPELWKSNGSPASTVRVKDINPGEEGSSPSFLTDVNGTLFFAAHIEGKGTELWRSDGTNGGTVLVKDIRVGRQGSDAAWLTNVGGTLYFAANDGKKGHELWKSNGTSAGTEMVKDLRSGAYLGSAPRQLTNVNGTLFFEAKDGAGRELWKSNGTSGTTIRLKDIHRGTASAGIENMTAVNNTLFFSATDGTHGQELWKSDGTEAGTVLVKDVNPGSTGSIPRHPDKQSVAQFTNINGVLYFITTTGNRYFIQRSDGTAHGTTTISDVRGRSGDVPQPSFTYRNGYVYFFYFEYHYPTRYYLIKMPYLGSAGSIVATFEVSEDYEERETEFELEMVRLNNAVFFGGRPYMEEENYGGYELIRSDGTEAGTFPIHDTFVPTRGSFPQEMISVNGLVYFHLYPWLSYSPELYRTDGTPEGTFQIRPSRYYYEWEAVGNDLYFVETDRYAWELYKTSGTLESTRLVTYTPESDGEASMPKGLTDVNGMLYYFNDLGELWKSNGTADGTERIADLYSIKIITNVNGVAYVIAENESNGIELWKTVSSGSVLVKTIANAHASVPYYHEGALSIGGVLYFLTQEDSGYHIWRSDGTSAGTYRMFGQDGFQGNSELRLIRYNEKLYFSDGMAFYSTDGNTYAKVAELPSLMKFTEANGRLILFTVGEDGLLVYGSDGSPEGTELLHKKALEMYHISTATIGKYVYYNTIYTPYTYFGADLWRTDGTICGTTRVDVGTSNPYALGAAGDDLVFGASLPATGNEPYVYHNINSILGSVCQEPGTPLAAATFESTTSEDILTFYPNPFTASFTMRINGTDGDMAEVVILTGTGTPVDKIENVPANVELKFGGIWQKGLYIIKVRIGHKLQTYHLVKK